MQYNFLGNSGLLVSQIGYGNMANFQPEDEEVNTAIIKRAYELGINFFDTAEFYQNGLAEAQLGRALKQLNIPRERVVITTKFFANALEGGNNVNRVFSLSRKHIIEAIKISLNNLQLDYVDVVYAHQWVADCPMDEICNGFNQIIENGQAFYWATSNWNAQQIQQAINYCDKHGLIKPIAEQGEYHMLERKKFEVELTPLYETYKYGTTTYSPLCGGFLTGKYLDGIPENSRCGKDNGWLTKERASNRILHKFTSNPRIIEGLKEFVKLAQELGYTPAQLALAWVIRNKDVSTAIIGARSVNQLDENIKALELLKKFDNNLDDRLDKIFENRPITDTDFRKWQPRQSRR